MSFSAFCALYGAPMKNPRNSWCAYAPEKHLAFFTVWADELVNGRYIFWLTAGAAHQTRPGATELYKVIKAVMQTGDGAFGILCYAKDKDADPRVRLRFIEDKVLVLRFVEEPEGLIAYVQGEVTPANAVLGRIANISPMQSAIDDLNDPPLGFTRPEKILRQTQGYRRDEAVRCHVIARARGRCEYCQKSEFLMPSGHTYLETHHIISLANQGPDTVQNVIALCASHHREAHYGNDSKQLEQAFISKLAAIT